MATLNTKVFEQTLQQFKQSLTPDQRANFPDTTLQQLQLTIAAIQKKQDSSRTMQNLPRIQRFLEAMQIYTKVLDVFVNVNDFVAFIWGPIKYLLLVAQTFAEAFNALLDAYQRISENLPILEQCQSLFGNDPRMQNVLEATFRDIFEFHTLALNYFSKKVWKQLFHATWTSFNTKFGTILADLRCHRELVETQASLSEFREARDARERAITAFNATAAYELHMNRLRVIDWLAAPDAQADQDRGATARRHHSHSGQWLRRRSEYRTWHNPQTNSTPLLWIHGIPGVGKSVLASWIVEEAMKLTGVTILYFYCRNGDVLRNNFVAMARCFLAKLLTSDDIVVQLLEASANSGEPVLRTQKLAGQLLETAFKASSRKYIILDGLDECDAVEQKHIANWLKAYVNDSSAEAEPSKCVFLSQKDPCTSALLSKMPTLRISADDNRTDIEAYCSVIAAQIQVKFGLAADEVSAIARDTALRAQGMFLYAHLVMQNLLDQNSRRDLDDELRPGNFPDGFEKAYDRILHRVLLLSTKANRRDAKKVLAWIVCAKRPLKWREIQTAFSIDSEAQRVNVKRDKRLLCAQDLCGALIEEGHGEDCEIELVHVSAKHHITSREYVNPPVEHLNMASMCLEYFCMPMLCSDATDEQVDTNILDGSFGFVDYALTNWTAHTELSLGANPSQDTMEPFLETVEAFFDTHWQTPKQKPKVPKHLFNVAKMGPNVSEELRDRLIATMSSIATLTTSHLADVESLATTKTLEVVRRIRERTEAIHKQQPSSHAMLAEYYGDRLFKCARLCCYKFYDGFTTLKEREVHREKHDRSHYCPHFGCLTATVGCATKKELDAHIAMYHPEDVVGPEFPADGDALATKAAEEDEKLVKDPARHYCDQCDRHFSKRYNLNAHKRKHEEGHSFPCNTCGKTFGRKGERARHDKQHHSREKKFMCNGITKSGITWGCGKDFGRVDLLGRHFRTAAGHACLQPSRDAMRAEIHEAAGTLPKLHPTTDGAADDIKSETLRPYLPVPSVTRSPTPGTPVTTHPRTQTPEHFLPKGILQQYPELANTDWDDVRLAPFYADTADQRGLRIPLLMPRLKTPPVAD